MKNLMLASLIALASSSTAVVSAAPHAAPPPPPACATTGPVLFGVDETPKGGHLTRASGSTFKLFPSGAYAFGVTTGGKTTRTVQGCVPLAQVVAVRNALAQATWTVTRAKLRCMAESMTWTQYTANGKPVFRHEMCDGNTLDAASSSVLRELTALVSTLTAIPVGAKP